MRKVLYFIYSTHIELVVNQVKARINYIKFTEKMCEGFKRSIIEIHT